MSLSALLCLCTMTPPHLWTLSFSYIPIKLFQCDAGGKAPSPSQQCCFEQAMAEGSGKRCLRTMLTQPCCITVSPASHSPALEMLQRAMEPRPCLPYFLSPGKGCQEPQLEVHRTTHGAQLSPYSRPAPKHLWLSQGKIYVIFPIKPSYTPLTLEVFRAEQKQHTLS